jgi:Protein of unknown function (DUF3584)
MTPYGVQRLIIINSGNYSYADVDLSKPVHLTARNNRGKSTLVNALQFLYVDDFAKMKFGKRNHEDTARHYFGEERSYLVFECQTPTGILCMLVHGSTRLRSGHFERYVYDGEYQRSDYVDGRDIKEFGSVRSALADRHFALIKSSELWQVLGSSLASMPDSEMIPRLNILPIRKKEEYLIFRNVFVRLLSLSNADARDLRQLIIESHGREVGERRVDIAAEYKDEFGRAERSEQGLKFIHAIADTIDKGIERRLELKSLTDKTTTVMPRVLIDRRRCYALIHEKEQLLKNETARLAAECQEVQFEKDISLTTKGKLQTHLEAIENEWSGLLALHTKWSVVSPEFINQMRESAKQLLIETAEWERALEHAVKFDVGTLQREVDKLQRKIDTERKTLERWECTAAAELLRAGVSNAELDAAFRVANPELLTLIVGESLTIDDRDALVRRIREVAQRVKDGTYADNAIRADLTGIAGPESQNLGDPGELRKQLALNDENLKQYEPRLMAAQDNEQARNNLDAVKEEYSTRRREVEEFERYEVAWSHRTQLEAKLDDAKRPAAQIILTINSLDERLRILATASKQIETELNSIYELKKVLDSVAQDAEQELQRQGLSSLLPSIGDFTENGQPTKPESLESFVNSVVGKMSELANDARRIADGRKQLREIETTIMEVSRSFEGQRLYFSDGDDEWAALIEARESLPQMEEASKKLWDSLFAILGAKLNAFVTAVRDIKLAVERISRGLKTYRVSNLRAVNIRVEVRGDTYSAVEALANPQGLFNDPEEVDLAKKRLRLMIESNEMIDLQSLFEVRIEIHEIDGSSREAQSLDEIGSTGTGMTAKAMIFIQLVRVIANDEKYRLHFYIDGLGELDDPNLEATASMAVSKGIVPITADPRLHLEPLAHPEVTVYSLGQGPPPAGKFYIDQFKTYHARRKVKPLTGPANE